MWIREILSTCQKRTSPRAFLVGMEIALKRGLCAPATGWMEMWISGQARQTELSATKYPMVVFNTTYKNHETDNPEEGDVQQQKEGSRSRVRPVKYSRITSGTIYLQNGVEFSSP